jgi:hypothetical protein
MKSLFLTAILALTFSTVASAFETSGVECPALAESNKRESKVVAETSTTSNESETSNVIQD